MKKYKILLLITGVLLVVGIGALYFLNGYLKNQIISGLENDVESDTLTYDDISINVLGGNATITNLLFKDKGVEVRARKVNVRSFSYTSYLGDGNIEIGLIEIVSPDVLINRSDTTDTEKSQTSEQGEDRNLLLDKFRVIGGSFRVIDNDTASNSLFLSIKGIDFEEVLFGNKNEADMLPFEYASRRIESDSLYYDMNEWQYLSIQNFKITEDLEISNLNMAPKFSREQFDRRLSFEKDWMALNVEKVALREFEIYKENDSIIFKSPQTSIDNANFNLYRNKLVAEDTRLKPMYSQMLRELGIKVQLDTILIKNSQIVYEEKVLETRPPAQLSFANIDIGIKDLVNFYDGGGDFPVTRIKAEADFMGDSHLTLNMSFDVSNPIDEFQVAGRLNSINAREMNSFLKHAMNVETEGTIESLAYNFYGNRNVAKGNMQMGYRDFNVHILKDGEEKRRSLLTRLANLIIKNDAVNEDVRQEDIEVERDKTKSFWNFLWLCIRDGALKTFF